MKQIFRNRPTLGPVPRVSLKMGTCAFCSMPTAILCEIPSCNLPLCEKHRIRKAGGNLCPTHKGAVLVQYDGLPTERFGDRGEAYPIELGNRSKQNS